jgi:hypothetical protein
MFIMDFMVQSLYVSVATTSIAELTAGNEDLLQTSQLVYLSQLHFLRTSWQRLDHRLDPQLHAILAMAIPQAKRPILLANQARFHR